MQLKKWVYQVPHSRSASPFLTGRSGFFLQPPSPGSLAQTGFILSYASVLFRVLHSPVRPESEDSKRLPWGLRSLIATSTTRVQAPSHPICSSTFPPSTFLTSSTVYSAVGFVGLFHPTATSRVHSSGVSSSSAAASPFSDRCPLVVVSTPLTAVAHRLHLVEPRPQGFHPRPNP